MRYLSTLIVALTLGIASALASSLTLVGVGDNGVTGLPKITYNATQNTCQSAGTTCTFATLPAGTADATRYMVFVLHWISGSSVVSSFTVNGGATTLIASNVSASARTSMYAASVATGATVNAVATMSVALGAGGIDVASYSLYNLASTTPDNSQTSTAAPGTFSLTTVTGGAAVFGATTSAVIPSIAFSADFTQRYNQQLGANANAFDGGGDVLTNGATISPTATYGTASTGVFLGASWH